MNTRTARTASQFAQPNAQVTETSTDRLAGRDDAATSARDGYKPYQGTPCASHQEAKELAAYQRRTGANANAYTFYNTALTSWCVKGGGPEPTSRESAGTAGLRSLQLIETVGDSEPFVIVPVSLRQGTAQAATEVMALKVKWAEKATYRVLTRSVPAQFAPYNAIIRISDIGTEDFRRDYLAEIEE